MSQIEKAAAVTWSANSAQKAEKKMRRNNDNNTHTDKLQRQHEQCNLENFEFPYNHQNGKFFAYKRIH